MRLRLFRNALLMLAAVGLQVPGAASAQTAPAIRPAHSLPPALMAQLLKAIAAQGRDTALPASIAPDLGLTAKGAAWPDRQFAVQSQATGMVHTAAAGPAPDSDLVLSVRGDAAIPLFRVRRDGTMAGAVEFFPQTQLSSMALPGDAARDFDAEILFWTRTLESLAAGD